MLTQRDRDIWRVAITLANNLCVQASDRLNDNDGHTEAINTASECAKSIRGWATPSDHQLQEMLSEAAVAPAVNWSLEEVLQGLNVKEHDLLAQASAIQLLIAQITQIQNNYLRSQGWEYACDIPGAIWHWKRILPDGSVVRADLNLAMRMQAQR